MKKVNGSPKHCWWCGNLLGIDRYAEEAVGGTMVYFHTGILHSCLRAYHRSQEKKLKDLEARVKAAGLTH